MATDKIYCSNTKTLAGMMGMLRSLLRHGTIRWKPRNDFLIKIRRPYVGVCKKTKWEYPCAECQQWFVRTKVEVDHIIECGSLKDWSDLPGFAQRLFAEEGGWACLCKVCHKKKTDAGKAAKKNARAQ